MSVVTEKDVELTSPEAVNFDSDHYLRPVVKLIFLKYIEMNHEIIDIPERCPRVRDQLCAELSLVSDYLAPEEWLAIMKSWVNRVRENYENLKNNRKTIKWTTEDLDLLSLIESNLNKRGPTKNQLSCILDHLEVVSSSPRVWQTISLEMKALGAPTYGGDYWRKSFEKWANKVRKKKQILDGIEPYRIGKKSYLSALENRLLCFLETCGNLDTTDSKTEELVCRVCLIEKANDLCYIHNTFLETPCTIANKIEQFANVEEISKTDDLPQYICKTCLSLLEKAWKFKSICERSDQQLRNSEKTVKREELIDYIIETPCYPEDRIEEDTQDNDMISIEFDSESNTIVNMYIDSEEDAVEQVCKVNTSQDIDTDIHQCEICGVVCYNQSSLKKHKNSHTTNRPHQCTVCSKEFITKLSLKIHMRSHTGERPYVCEVCGKAFTQECSLQYHRAIHTGEKKYACQICDHRFRSKNDLKIHLRTHTGIRPYACNICPAKFSTSSLQQRHRRRHAGIKNYKTCGKAFKTWSAASNHRAIHSGIKSFECAHCSYKGSTKANLQIHSRTHTGIQPYACPSCSMKFSTASNRRKHIKNVHQKMKVHKCKTCDRSFFSQESVRKHMVKHTGLKPYTCPDCPLTYGWYNGLQKHMKTKHPESKIPGEKYYLDLPDKSF